MGGGMTDSHKVQKAEWRWTDWKFWLLLGNKLATKTTMDYLCWISKASPLVVPPDNNPFPTFFKVGVAKISMHTTFIFLFCLSEGEATYNPLITASAKLWPCLHEAMTFRLLPQQSNDPQIMASCYDCLSKAMTLRLLPQQSYDPSIKDTAFLNFLPFTTGCLLFWWITSY